MLALEKDYRVKKERLHYEDFSLYYLYYDFKNIMHGIWKTYIKSNKYDNKFYKQKHGKYLSDFLN